MALGASLMKRFGTGIALLAVSLAPLALAPLASARTPEEAFLRELEHDQIPITDPDAAVSLARHLCTRLENGASPSSAKSQITANSPDLEGISASIFLDSAVTYLCPAQMDLPSLGLPPNMQHGYS